MTPEQALKLKQIADALDRSGVRQGLPGSHDTIEWAVDSIHELLRNSAHNPFTDHWAV